MATDQILELKKTVNLPKTGFAQKANLGQSEPLRLKKWQEMGLYDLIQKARQGSEKFILHDGPPYANAEIHLGTAVNKILKDFIVKSRTMLNFDTPYVPGFDCHGLPIELYVDKALGAKKANMPPVSIRRACREHAAKSLRSQTRDFQRLGILGEWDNPYLTMSNSYEAETARLFGRFIERGYVYKGARPVYWCVFDQTALAEAEVEYKQHTSNSVYVKFPFAGDPAEIATELAGRKVFFLIWTTTPWTLPANLGIAVNPDFEYAAIENGDEVYIVASELVESVAAKCGLGNLTENGENSPVTVLARFAGSTLDRIQCRHAWIDRPSIVMLGEHVTLGGEADAESELDVKEARERSTTAKGAGTGCVHTAPGHGHDDFVIGKRYGLDVYCPVDSGGRFNAEVEHFAGQLVFDANEKIIEFMKQGGMLLYSESYSHRYPHCWRCHNPVIFRATPQWFISMDAVNGDGNIERDEDGRAIESFENFDETGESLRAGALREIKRVKWIPAWGEDRMRNMLKNRPDWCVSRQRVWGVPIPVFYCEGCNAAVADAAIVNHVADIFENESADAWYSRDAADLLPEGFSCSECGRTQWKKETDILDVWFDSGSSSVAVLERRDNLRWPADVYLEGGDQYRGWFNSSLMVGLAAHDAAPYGTVLTHGWVVDGQGKAMHKSTGNAVSPNEIMKESGAEILRLWTASTDYHEDMRCSAEILQRISDTYRKLRNTARYALGNLDGFDPAVDSVRYDELLDIDKWALAELDAVIAKVHAGYEAFEFHTVYHALYNLATVILSARYFDIIKDRLYTAAPKSHSRRSAQTALHHIAGAFARMLAPILVFTADEIWENLPKSSDSGFSSVHLESLPVDDGRDNAALLAEWEALFKIRDQVLRTLEDSRNAKTIGSSLEAKVELTAGGASWDLLDRHRDDLRYIFIVSSVTLLKQDSLSGDGRIELKVEVADGEKCERCWNYSTHVGESERYPAACERCLSALNEIEAAQDFRS